MAASAVPPTRLPQPTRTAVREVLLAELVSARTRARAAGCPPEVLFDVLDTRLRSAAAEESHGGRPGLDPRSCPAAHEVSAAEPRPAGDDGRKPGVAGDAGRSVRCVPPRPAAGDACWPPGL